MWRNLETDVSLSHGLTLDKGYETLLRSCIPVTSNFSPNELFFSANKGPLKLTLEQRLHLHNSADIHLVSQFRLGALGLSAQQGTLRSIYSLLNQTLLWQQSELKLLKQNAKVWTYQPSMKPDYSSRVVSSCEANFELPEVGLLLSIDMLLWIISVKAMDLNHLQGGLILTGDRLESFQLGEELLDVASKAIAFTLGGHTYQVYYHESGQTAGLRTKITGAGLMTLVLEAPGRS